ncbi:unnamed protein product, partial [Ectocarpus sp. 4 AP-2014]
MLIICCNRLLAGFSCCGGRVAPVVKLCVPCTIRMVYAYGSWFQMPARHCCLVGKLANPNNATATDQGIPSELTQESMVMGQNFALNMASHGFSVSVCNRSPGKVDTTVERAKEEGDLPLVGYKEPKEFIESLAKPRKVMLLVQAGAAVDATIATLSEFMEEGDIVVDCGNEWFPNSQRRAKELEPKKIMFVGMGISGGEEGARNGPSLMPGGPKEAFDALAPIITKCAAQV